MKQAVGYLRVSTKSQVEGDGLLRQREAIKRWAKANRFEVIAWYEEEGVSGSLELRPALGKMLVALAESLEEVELVLVEGLDRLARELMVQESILLEVWKTGKEVLSVNTGHRAKEEEEPSRTMLRQIMGAVAQYEKALMLQKLAEARGRERQRVGRCEGRKPFGFYPGEDETLKEIRRLRTKRGGKRLSYAKVAQALNEGSYVSRTGKAWKAGTVQGIVKRELPNLA